MSRASQAQAELRLEDILLAWSRGSLGSWSVAARDSRMVSA